MTVVDRIEHSPLWFIGRILIPGRFRVAACIDRGEHHPELIDLGRSKMCVNCGGW